MPGVNLPPREVNVKLFEYDTTVLVGYILLVLFIISLHRGYKTRQRIWLYAAVLLGVAGLSLLLLNLYLLRVPSLG